MTVEMIKASQIGMKALGAGLAVGLTGIATGIAEMAVGSAAVGAPRLKTRTYSVWFFSSLLSTNYRDIRSRRQPAAVICRSGLWDWMQSSEEIRQRAQQEVNRVRSESQQETTRVLSAIRSGEAR